jgi:hypothetical protein
LNFSLLGYIFGFFMKDKDRISKGEGEKIYNVYTYGKIKFIFSKLLIRFYCREEIFILKFMLIFWFMFNYLLFENKFI